MKTKKIFISNDTYITVNIDDYKKTKNVINVEIGNEVIKCKAFEMKDCFILVPEKLVLED